jgi:hypothetical protein
VIQDDGGFRIGTRLATQIVTFRLRDSLPVHRVFTPSSMTSGEAFAAMDRLLDLARSGPTFLGQACYCSIGIDFN